MRVSSITAVSLVALTACSLPRAGEGISEARALLETTRLEIQKEIGPRATQELKVAEDALIAHGAEVLVFSGICDPATARNTDPSVLAEAECQLETLANPGGTEVNAYETSAALTAMQEYWDALAVLADATTREGIDRASAALVGKVGGLVDALPNGDGSNVRDRGPAFATLLGVAVDQLRVSRLRAIMTEADPVMERLTEGATAWLSLRPGEERAVYDAFAAARTEVLDAEVSGNPARYRKAIEDARAAFEALQTYQATSAIERLWLVRRAHADVLARLSNPTAEDVLTTLEEIKAARDTLQAEDQS